MQDRGTEERDDTLVFLQLLRIVLDQEPQDGGSQAEWKQDAWNDTSLNYSWTQYGNLVERTYQKTSSLRQYVD